MRLYVGDELGRHGVGQAQVVADLAGLLESLPVTCPGDSFLRGYLGFPYKAPAKSARPYKVAYRRGMEEAQEVLKRAVAGPG